MHPGIGFAIVIALYGLVAWAGFRWARSRLNRRAREVRAALEGAGVTILAHREAPSVRRRAEIDVEHNGQKATVSVRQWGRDSHLISVSLVEPPQPPIWIRRERAFDRMAKALGFAREVQLGVAEFDEAHYLASSAPDEVVKATLAGAETRRLITEIVELGFGVTLSREGVSASTLKGILSRFEGGQVPTLVERLRKLAAALPRTSSIDSYKTPVSTATILVPAFASIFLPLLVSVWGVRSFLHPPVDNGAVLLAIVLGVVPWLLAVVWVGRRLRSRPLAILEVPAVALALLTWVPFTFAFGLFLINSHWDRGAPVHHRLRVVDYYKRNSHTVYVAPWDSTGRRQKVIVPLSIERVAIGDELEIEAHPGALGWTWVSDVRPAR